MNQIINQIMFCMNHEMESVKNKIKNNFFYKTIRIIENKTKIDEVTSLRWVVSSQFFPE